ncbi:MAG: hypothetical protein WCC21_05225 [Candidatus Acidiferrales bacterium]
MAPSATAVEMEAWLQRILMVLIFAVAAAVHVDAQTLQRASASNQRAASNVSAPAPHTSSPGSAAAPLAQNFTVRDFVRQRSDEDAGRENLKNFESSLFQTTKTPFMTRTRMPIAHAFGSRLQFNFDMTSTSNKNLIAGPLVPAQMTEQEFVQGHSEDRYGISLSVPLGRGAESGASKGLLTGLARAFHRN